jgi:hypothetical protein
MLRESRAASFVPGEWAKAAARNRFFDEQLLVVGYKVTALLTVNLTRPKGQI